MLYCYNFSCYHVDMKRKILDDLKHWKTQSNRKPLILWGARQVGKTWILKEFGRQCYEKTLYISFYNNRRTAQIFEQDFDVKRIMSALEIQYKVKINPSDTLLIFDEVQEAPKILESLKYFNEEAPEYSIVCAGSLLGVTIHEGVSFPVGKVNELHLYPMDFCEYLMAVGADGLVSIISDFANPQNVALRDDIIAHLKNYYFVGGMPECVKAFSEHGDYSEVREIQNDILSQYEGDFSKHIPSNEISRVRMVWHSLPIQLAKENRKFFFGQIKEGARMKDFEVALQWLSDAGLIHKVSKISKPNVPLKAYLDFTSFKVFLSDIGLLAAMSELDVETIVNRNDVFVEFKGALTEQFVLQQLISSTKYIPYYFSGEKSTYETDFIIQKGMDVVPIEVKAEENLKSKSFKVYCEKYKPRYAVRLSMAGYMPQEWMTNIPLWCVQSI